MIRHSKIDRNSLRTKEQLKAEIDRWAGVMKVNPLQIRVQMMKRKWASCSSKGRICFSDDLLQETKDFQDYVIVHELLHLHIPNHGKLFKSLMNAYLPSWQSILEERVGDKLRDTQLTY